MLKKSRILFIILLCLFIINIIPTSTYAFLDSNVFITLDKANKDAIPDNFRKTTDLSKLKDCSINTTGLENLNISGSAQFAALSLLELKKNINTKLPIYDIDLREESHGFVNGNAVSWYGPGNNANAGLSLDEIIQKENSQLSAIPFGKSLSLDNGKYTLTPTIVENEEKLVTPNNIKYFRIPVKDGGRPTDEMVDRFLSFTNCHKSDVWLHFHCKEGQGRTTTFMVLYDIMENSKNVSLEDIINRQFTLGGLNLLKPCDEGNRANFIKNFYIYAKENNDNFKTSWSEWVSKNNIPTYTLKDELPKQ